MGKHSKHEAGHRHQRGSLQELATMMIKHLGGLDNEPEPEPAASTPPDDGWVNFDTLMQQQRAGKAVRR